MLKTGGVFGFKEFFEVIFLFIKVEADNTTKETVRTILWWIWKVSEIHSSWESIETLKTNITKRMKIKKENNLNVVIVFKTYRRRIKVQFRKRI